MPSHKHEIMYRQGRDVRDDFPVLSEVHTGHPLTYLDSAASAQMPLPVLQTMVDFQTHSYANIHRGLYRLSGQSTEAYDNARQTVADFIGAKEAAEVIFTRGTTESINFLAYTWGETNIQAGDEIVLPISEHHANLVPWQQLALRKGATLRWIDITPEGTLDGDSMRAALARHPKLVTMAWISNVFGTIHDLETWVKEAHEVGATFILDGAQGVPHLATDVQKMDIDFLAFSGHKMMGPTGIGVLWGKRELLEKLPPFQFGGDMISVVKKERSTWDTLPNRLEAGTPNITGAVGLAAACDYLKDIGLETIREHDLELLDYAIDGLKSIGAEVLGPEDLHKRSSVISFRFNNIHPHDISTILGREEICVRAGHHCCQPLMREIGMMGTTRASIYVYNTFADIDRLLEGLGKVGDIFSFLSCPCEKKVPKKIIASGECPCAENCPKQEDGQATACACPNADSANPPACAMPIISIRKKQEN